MKPEAVRLALRPGDVVLTGEDVVRVARIGQSSLVGVPLAGEPEVVTVAYEAVEGVVVRELDADIGALVTKDGDY